MLEYTINCFITKNLKSNEIDYNKRYDESNNDKIINHEQEIY